MNNTKKSSLKPVLTSVVIIIVAVIAYFYYEGSKSPADVGLLQQNDPETDAASARVVQLLTQVGSIRIDSTFFSSPSFKTLWDHTVPVPQQNVGRPNPFAPYPGMVNKATKP